VLTFMAIVLVIVVLGGGILAAGAHDRTRPRVDGAVRAGQHEPPATGPIRATTSSDGFSAGFGGGWC